MVFRVTFSVIWLMSIPLY